MVRFFVNNICLCCVIVAKIICFSKPIINIADFGLAEEVNSSPCLNSMLLYAGKDSIPFLCCIASFKISKYVYICTSVTHMSISGHTIAALLTLKALF